MVIRFLLQEFDLSYGPAWHCIVGTSFGSYVTHSLGCFLYFSIDKVYILLFRTAVEPLGHWRAHHNSNEWFQVNVDAWSTVSFISRPSHHYWTCSNNVINMYNCNSKRAQNNWLLFFVLSNILSTSVMSFLRCQICWMCLSLIG